MGLNKLVSLTTRLQAHVVKSDGADVFEPQPLK